MQKYSVLIIGVVAITILESLAILKGIDGYALAASFAAIGGIAGYSLKYIRRKEHGL